MIRFSCPACHKIFKVVDGGAGRKINCPQCGQRMLVPTPAQPAALNKTVLGQGLPDTSKDDANLSLTDKIDGTRGVEDKQLSSCESRVPDLKYSWLGIASFLIALAVGGLELIVAFMIERSYTNAAFEHAVAKCSTLAALNFLIVPACLAGGGLGAVAFLVHKDYDHLFSRLGLWGNGIVIAIIFIMAYHILF